MASPRVHIAARELKGSLSSYASKFGLLELHPTVQAGSSAASPRTNPTLKTLRAWRKEAGPAFEFCIVAPPALRSPRPSEQLDIEVAATLATVDAVQARTLLVQTASDCTPSNVWRDRLTKLVERLQRDGTQIVWEPSGLWEAEDAALFAKKLGIVLCVDPFQSGVPRGPIAYLRLRALGETRSFGGARIEALAAELRDRREVYVVMEAPKALSTAQTLDDLIRHPPRAAGGTVVPRRAAAATAVDEEE
jgi:uncharacterized protein YecE (DUF72 family)